jgi:hypothetical protein
METSSQERILKHFGNPHHPVCAAAVATHLFLDARSPSCIRRGIASLAFIHRFIDRAQVLLIF